MHHRPVRRFVAVLAVATTAFGLAGCNMAKVGAKCRNGAAPARDATHVLFCQKGKWARVMTIGQAADFIMSGWPSNVELLDGGGQTVGLGDAFGQVSVRVTRRDGQPVKGADVLFAGPASGASIAAPSGLIATDSNGVARFTPVANSVVGGYAVTATVNGGTRPSVTFGLNNAAGRAASVVVVSGNDQTAVAGTQFAQPVVVRAVDRFGNTVTYKNIEFSTSAAGVWFGPAEAFAGDDGKASTTMGTGNLARTVPVTAKVVGTDASVTFNMHVVAGPAVAANFHMTSGNGQTSRSSTDPDYPLRFDNPLVVAFSDLFGNPVSGQTATWAIVDGGAGTASATMTVAASDADGLARARLTSNGIAGTFQVTATAFGITETFNLTNPA